MTNIVPENCLIVCDLWRSNNHSHTLRLSFNVKYSSDLTPYHIPFFFVVELKLKDISCEKMHMESILV